MARRICKHWDRHGHCHQDTLKVPDKDKLVEMWHNTGRNDWNGNVIIVKTICHPVNSTNLCFYHSKQLEGLI